MFKRLLFLAAVTAVFITVSKESIITFSKSEFDKTTFNDLSGSFSWASEAVSTLAKKDAVNGIEDNVFSPKGAVSREQFAKMLVLSLDIDHPIPATQTFLDVPSTRWSFRYVEAAKDFFPKKTDLPINEFSPDEHISREEFVAAVVKALGLAASDDDSETLSAFSDSGDAAPNLASALALAVKKNIISGSDSALRPKSSVNRAEAAVMLHRALMIKNGQEVYKDTSTKLTPIAGESTVSLTQAKAWAASKRAHERFINIADIYWKYGTETNLRPEVLYAQAAKETNYGKYTGNVVPEQNNWAGIKTKTASGDKTEDHETFASPDEGVRAHFNHMSAYLGEPPQGETHDRYAVVAAAAWAGEIEFVEELGGRWAPAASYGYDIVEKYLAPMQNTVVS